MKPPDPTRTLVTIKEATVLTGVSRRAIYNWINMGKVECIRTIGGATRIYEDTLWQVARARPPSPLRDGLT